MLSDTLSSPVADTEATQEIVLILDFGAQYTQFIARRVRESHVYCEILPFDTPIAEIQSRRPRGIIFSGGPSSVYEKGAPHVDPRVYELGIPILGICYGQQLMAYQLGGEVQATQNREYGDAELIVLNAKPLFAGIAENGSRLPCWMSHGDKVLAPPDGFEIAATTDSTPVAAMINTTRQSMVFSFTRKSPTRHLARSCFALSFWGRADARELGPLPTS